MKKIRIAETLLDMITQEAQYLMKNKSSPMSDETRMTVNRILLLASATSDFLDANEELILREDKNAANKNL